MNPHVFHHATTPNNVATPRGKRGIWFLPFPDRENTGNFVVRQGKYLYCIINAKIMFLIAYFENVYPFSLGIN